MDPLRPVLFRVVLVLALLAGCGGPTEPSGGGGSTTPSPIGAYLVEVHAADPALRHLPSDQAVARGEQTCTDLRGGLLEHDAIGRAQQRWQVDRTAAVRLVGAARQHLC